MDVIYPILGSFLELSRFLDIKLDCSRVIGSVWNLDRFQDLVESGAGGGWGEEKSFRVVNIYRHDTNKPSSIYSSSWSGRIPCQSFSGKL